MRRGSALVVALAAAVPSLADARPTRTYILLDTSASMRANDPDRASIEAARLYSSLAEPGDRVGVMTYDQAARVVMPLAPGRHGALDDLEIEFDGARTDLETALLAGFDRLRVHPDPGFDDVLVVLCDGSVELGMAATAAEEASVERIREAVLPRLAAGGVRVFTIGLGPGADTALLETVAAATGGAARHVQDAAVLHRAFAETAVEANGSELLPAGAHGFVTDEYRPSLSVLLTPANGSASLVTPTDVPLTADTEATHIRWTKAGAYELVNIAQAQPGPWRFERISYDVPAFVVVRGGELRLRADVDQRQQILVELLYEGRRSNSFKLHDRLEVAAQVEAPDGSVREVTLERAPDGRYFGSVASGQAGRHRVRVVADGPSLQRERRLSFVAPVRAEPVIAAVPAADESVSSVWPWLFGVAMLILAGAVAMVFVTRRRTVRSQAMLVEELETTKAALEEIESRPPPAPPQPEWQVALLTAEDAGLLFPEEDHSKEQALRGALEETQRALETLAEAQAGWQEMFDGLMQSALNVTNAIHQQEQDPEEGRATLELAAMTVHDEIGRLSDGAAGLGTALEETGAQVASLLAAADEQPRERRRDHNDINELIMSRADGQTAKEFERLREEMLRSLRDEDDDVSALRGELAELKGNVEALEKERGWLEASLEEVTMEYEKVLDEFRS